MNTGTSPGKASRSVPISHSGLAGTADRASSNSLPHAERPPSAGKAEMIASSAARASATIPTTTGWFTPIWSGSRSIWIKFFGTGIRRQSVMTSVNRQPAASMASACGRTLPGADRAGMPQRTRLALVEQAFAVQRGDDRCANRSANSSIASAAPTRRTTARQNDRAMSSRQDRRSLRGRIQRHRRHGLEGK